MKNDMGIGHVLVGLRLQINQKIWILFALVIIAMMILMILGVVTVHCMFLKRSLKKNNYLVQFLNVEL